MPLGCGIPVSNVGFHAPLNHPGFPNDGSFGDAGFSNAAWTSDQTPNALTWSTETFAQNQNANAIRWGTLYNFRFDSDRPPVAGNATIGFFKTGTPITVAIMGPNPCTGQHPLPPQPERRREVQHRRHSPSISPLGYAFRQVTTSALADSSLPERAQRNWEASYGTCNGTFVSRLWYPRSARGPDS